MRYIRFAILAAIAASLITVALANLGQVTLTLLPPALAELLNFPAELTSVKMPLFLVLFGGIIAGLLLGFVWEWLREHKHRAEAAGQRREKEKLAREVTRMKSARPEQTDDVLALLEDSTASR